MELAQTDFRDGAEFIPFFDPKAFIDSYGEIHLDTFRFEKGKLHGLAIKATQIRKKIMEKADAMKKKEDELEMAHKKAAESKESKMPRKIENQDAYKYNFSMLSPMLDEEKKKATKR